MGNLFIGFDGHYLNFQYSRVAWLVAGCSKEWGGKFSLAIPKNCCAKQNFLSD